MDISNIYLRQGQSISGTLVDVRIRAQKQKHFICGCLFTSWLWKLVYVTGHLGDNYVTSATAAAGYFPHKHL